MILNQPNFFARSATLDGAITGTDTQITLSALSTRFTDAVAAGTVRYPAGPFRVGDINDHERIAIIGHVSGNTFEVERGIQGTSEEAWADGTAVRAVVTREQLVSRIAVESQIWAPDEGTLYDDFNRPDGPIGTSPTGQVWNSGSIENGQVNSGFVPVTSTPLWFRFKYNAVARRGWSFYLAQTPEGDWIRFDTGSSGFNLRIEQNVSGSITSVIGDANFPHSRMQNMIVDITLSRRNTDNSEYHALFGAVGMNKTYVIDADAASDFTRIVNDSVEVGFIGGPDVFIQSLAFGGVR